MEKIKLEVAGVPAVLYGSRMVILSRCKAIQVMPPHLS